MSTVEKNVQGKMNVKEGKRERTPMTPKQKRRYERNQARRQKKKADRKVVRKPKNPGLNKYRKETGSVLIDPSVAPQRSSTAIQKMSGQTDVLSWVALPDDASFNQFVYGIVFYLTNLGYGSANDPATLQYPYQLANFLKQLMANAMSQSTYIATRAPRWLHILLNMLNPVVIAVRTGKVSFSWDMSVYSTTIPAIIAGSPSSTFGVPATGVSGTLAYGSIGAPLPYDQAMGTVAYNKMLEFSSTLGGNMFEIIDIASPIKPWLSDFSMFSQNYADFGSATALGGQSSSVYSVKKVACPMAATFVYYTEGYGCTQTELRSTATSPRYFASRLLTVKDENQLRCKFRPYFKPIDINDVYDLLSTIMGRAFEQQQSSSVEHVTYTPCPLSGSEVFIMLRALIASIMGASWVGDVNFPAFLPLQWQTAMGSSVTIQSTWLIPTFLIENLACLGAQEVNVAESKSDVVKSKYRNQSMTWIPIFGTYDDQRSVYDYTVTLSDGSTASLYNTNPVNGGAAFSQSSLLLLETSDQYILANGDNLSGAVGLWNDWVGTVNNNVQLSTWNSERGQVAIGLLTRTRYCIAVQSTQDRLARKKKNETFMVKRRERVGSKTIDMAVEVPSYRSRLKVTRVEPVSGTTDWSVVGVSSNESIPPPVFNYFAAMVLPKIRADTDGTNYVPEIKNSAQMAFMEPYGIPASNSASRDGSNTDTTITLSDMWVSAANNVTTAGADLSALPWTQLRAELTKMGSGGWLGSLVGDALSALAGNLIPI